MTTLSFTEDGVDVVYEGTEFRLERDLVEDATQKDYFDVTDHEILRIVETDPQLSGEARQIGDVIDAQ